MRALSDANVPDARIWAFVRGGREMVAWLTAHTAVRLRAHPYADYHPEMPGGKPGWRSLEALPLHASDLGADFEQLRPPHPAVQFLGRVSWTLEETGALLFRTPGWWQVALSIFGNYLLDFPQRLALAPRPAPDARQRAARAAETVRSTGWAARCGCAPRSSSCVREDGRVTGAVIEREGAAAAGGRGAGRAAGGRRFRAQRRDAPRVPAQARPSRAGAARS